MKLKRNLKLYLKQKSSIFAVCFLFLCLLTFALSFFPSIKYRDGIVETFKHYDIKYVTTNNYNVVYAVSEDNQLFYSQSKEVTSTLNTFAEIKTYENEYGSLKTKEHNFIRIPFEFPSKIVDVQGIGDNSSGKNGETLILLENKNVYMISGRSKNVQLILNDVLTLQVVQDVANANIISYLYTDSQNNLYYSYIDSTKLIRQKIAQDFKYESYSFIEHTKKGCDDSFTFFIKVQNQVKIFQSKITNDLENLSLVNSLNAYPIYQLNPLSIETKERDLHDFGIDEQIMASKFARIEGANYCSYYLLNEGKVMRIEYNYNTHTLSKNNLICSEFVDDIYTCGEEACIAITKKGLYFYGDLHFMQSDEQFISLEIKDGRIYGTRHSIIYVSGNNKFYDYNRNKKTYDSMYPSLFVNYIVRYFALFVSIMTILYLILSFIDANKRYNRYFSVNNTN